MLYIPSDILKNYKNIQLQMAILEYVATHDGTPSKIPEVFIDFAKYIDKSLLWRINNNDVTNSGSYLVALKLLKVEDSKLYITEDGIKCLQNYALQTTSISTQMNFISHINWIICTLISLTAIVISILE